jgi:hypothetical protein
METADWRKISIVLKMPRQGFECNGLISSRANGES